MSSSCPGMCGIQLSLIFLPISLDMASKCIIQIYVYFRKVSVQAQVRQDAQLNGSASAELTEILSGKKWGILENTALYARNISTTASYREETYWCV